MLETVFGQVTPENGLKELRGTPTEIPPADPCLICKCRLFSGRIGLRNFIPRSWLSEASQGSFSPPFWISFKPEPLNAHFPINVNVKQSPTVTRESLAHLQRLFNAVQQNNFFQFVDRTVPHSLVFSYQQDIGTPFESFTFLRKMSFTNCFPQVLPHSNYLQ